MAPLQSDGTGRFEIDTTSLPASDRVEFWRASVCDQFVPLAVEPTADALRGRVVGSTVAETRLRRIRASQHVFERRPADIRAGDPEVLHILAMDIGRAMLDQDGRSTVLSPGDLVLYDSSRPFRVETTGPFQFTIGLLPKRLLPMPQEAIIARTARATTPDSGVGAALGALLTSLASGRASQADPAQQVAMQHALVSLYVAFMSEDGAAGSPPSVHLALAKSFIVRNLGRPDPSPADVAEACGVSPSYLHRLFSNDGSTVSGFLREQRLQGARHDLTTVMRDEPIKAVAGRWGIPDPAHFSRLFKARFDLTPGEARHASQVAFERLRVDAG